MMWFFAVSIVAQLAAIIWLAERVGSYQTALRRIAGRYAVLYRRGARRRAQARQRVRELVPEPDYGPLLAMADDGCPNADLYCVVGGES